MTTLFGACPCCGHIENRVAPGQPTPVAPGSQPSVTATDRLAAPSVMYVCGGASMCDWNGHSWSDCFHDEAEACDCAEGPCRYCGLTHEQAKVRLAEFLKKLAEEIR